MLQTIDKKDLEGKTKKQLLAIAKELGLKGVARLKKQEIIESLYDYVVNTLSNKSQHEGVAESKEDNELVDSKQKELQEEKEDVEVEVKTPIYTIEVGALDIDAKTSRFGFIRTKNLTPSNDDVYIPESFIKSYKLKRGDLLKVRAQDPETLGNKYKSCVEILEINHIPISKRDFSKPRAIFDKLVPIYPLERLRLECNTCSISNRIIDLITPIGKGQRALIVAPPQAGKTILLKDIAKGIYTNYPDIILIALLVDERPEEVTDMQRTIADKGVVASSTFDKKPKDHAKLVDFVLEHSKRLVEEGKDVVILLDSITRLTRTYNLLIPPSGRTLSGGLDTAAIYKPKEFFGAARNIENGGSLTIIATALIETGSKMDDVIFEEFKGTGNMEIDLSRPLAERRIFPAIDILKSGTRHEELLYTPLELKVMRAIRKSIAVYTPIEASERFIAKVRKTKTNEEFLVKIMRNEI